ncbi:MAG TPA: hypothetical protein VKT80_01630 [Chloroflexota bacterium]|nr:hypothetical protein [Chloroflexota bacterium]
MTIRKLILASALATTLIPVVASAQSYGEVRQDQRELRHDRRELDRAYAGGDPRAIHDARREIRDARHETREDWRDYRRAHPDAFRSPRHVGPRAGWRYRPVDLAITHKYLNHLRVSERKLLNRENQL